MKTKDLNCQSLESMTYLTPSSTVKLPSLTLLLKQLWTAFVATLNPSNAPRVSRVQHPSGEKWYGYNPTTGHRVYLQSEQEMRVWLEQRYNSNSNN